MGNSQNSLEFRMMKNSYLLLKKVNPEDELLELATLSEEGELTFTKEYHQKFGGISAIKGYERYCSALDKAVEDSLPDLE